MAETDPVQRLSDDIQVLTRQVADLTHALAVAKMRLNRIDGDTMELKGDGDQLNRIGVMLQSGFDRMHARLDRLIELAERGVLGPS